MLSTAPPVPPVHLVPHTPTSSSSFGFRQALPNPSPPVYPRPIAQVKEKKRKDLYPKSHTKKKIKGITVTIRKKFTVESKKKAIAEEPKC
jgi:hypothetical protein